MKKHIEVKSYEYWGIEVMVRIDYDNKHISLVEYGERNQQGDRVFRNKSWVFVSRGIEYMGGWIKILDAMKHAIEEASKELKGYLDDKAREKTEEAGEILAEATKLVKKKK